MSVPDNFFYYCLCHYCKTYLENYRRCISCKSVAYCSEAHQKLDWKEHKKLCKAIVYSSQITHSHTQYTFDEWRTYRIELYKSWKCYLMRDLFNYEYQIFMFPRVCSICFTIDNLKDCSKCFCVVYCCDEHKQQHAWLHDKFCKETKLCLDIELYLSKGNYYPIIKTDLLVKCLHKATDMHELLKLFDRVDPCADDHTEIKTALRSDVMSVVAIIYNALKYVKMNTSKLIIHLVGASSTEAVTDWQLVSGVIFHYKPDLQEIRFILIGPEALTYSHKLNLSTTYLEGGKKASLQLFTNLYHEINDELDVPNLIIAFNCGIHNDEGRNIILDTWKESLPELVKRKEVPFLFTSYTEEELVKDSGRFKKLEGIPLKFLFYGKNPFAGIRPVRNWFIDTSPIFYSQGYMGIVMQTEVAK